MEGELQKDKNQKAQDKLKKERQKQAEIEASEKAANEQRVIRQKSRDAVISYLGALNLAGIEALQIKFASETNINHSDQEAFHDWTAELQDLGNP